MMLLGLSHARVITVDDDGPADYSRIDTALAHADAYDTIFVHAGNYHQYISGIYIPWWANPIYLIGSGAESTIVMWEFGHVCNFDGIKGEIRGFTFCGSTWGVGILADGTRCQIFDCILQNNMIGLYIDCTGSGVNKIHIEQNKIINNKIGILYSCLPEYVPPTTDSNYVIRNNNISYNRIGIYFDHEFEGIIPTPEIIDVTENWWGTIDTLEIFLSKYDYWLDDSVARLFYVFPFLEDSITSPDISEQGGIHRNNICHNMYYNIRCWSEYSDDPLVMAIEEPAEYENPNDFFISAFPNPFNSRTRIQMESKLQMDGISICLYDMSGKEVLHQCIGTIPPGVSEFSLQIPSGLQSGIYLLCAISNSRRTSAKTICIR